ncbi:MAG: carboxypeptidase-like regulatory domain-containing protein [Acidobacteriota bacterium]
MRSAAKLYLSILVLLIGTSNAAPQTAPTSPPKTPGTIAGRVSADGQPVAGVEVLLKPGGTPSGMDFLQSSLAATAITDSEGWYRFANVAPGSYRVVAYAPAHVIEGDNNPISPGKPVNVLEGEAVENVDFSITRGGVLTGKVTASNDRPVIAEFVRAHRLNNAGKSTSTGIPDFNVWQTDDRGVYRIFGLEPGRYIVGAGASPEDAVMRIATGGGSRAHYRRTFSPEAVEEAQARIIEVSPGVEVENIDIKLVSAAESRTFTATGRVIEAESGKSVAGLMITYTATRAGSGSFGMGTSATNSQGEFRWEGLKPNSYRASVLGLEASENYGEPIEFEISGSDVTGLEITMRRGVSISGVAVIEGSTDPKLREKLGNVRIFALPQEARGPLGMSIVVGQVNPNGTFKIGGVHPGNIRLSAETSLADKALSLLRVEHEGGEVRELHLSAGEATTGVRLVFAYGTASIAGNVEVRGGKLPPNVRLMVIALRGGGGEGTFDSRTAEVDARGQFLLEGLSQGNYRLSVGPLYFSAPETKLPKNEQTVTVVGNSRQEVTLVLDFSRKEEK